MGKRKNITAFIVIGILGALFHFVYEWTGENYFAGLFFPVSESSWEHLKLLFYPTLIYSAFEYYFSEKKPQNYLSAVSVSILGGFLTIIALFYTVKGIVGNTSSVFNILTFYVGLFVMLYIKQKIIEKGKLSSNLWFFVSIAILLIVAVCFVFFSFNPPSLGIFIPPEVVTTSG